VPRGNSLETTRRTESFKYTRPVAILTGGGDRPYAVGLAAAIIDQDIPFDFIGSDDLDFPELHRHPSVRFLNLRGCQRTDVSTAAKAWRLSVYYLRLIVYAANTKAKVFHLLWNNKFEIFDRTFLLLYYKLLQKQLAFTVHNVNAASRDGNDSAINRLTLRIQYYLVDHLFVHTEKMKRELMDEFGVPFRKISVIPFGINSTVPNTDLTPVEARRLIDVSAGAKTLLFFGNIAPYKGLEYLLEALSILTQSDPEYKLLIVGRPKGCQPYWQEIRQRIDAGKLQPYIFERIEFVPDEDTEIYFKAADVLVLPYTFIFQSGVLFLAYNFGVPVIAADVGSMRDDIVEGKTGLIFRPRDSTDLAKTISSHFASALHKDLGTERRAIRDYANERYSWAKVGEITNKVYQSLADNPNL